MSSKAVIPNSDNTVLRDIPPGYLTGQYIIAVSNLPFGTSWQQLKDFIRVVCSVDHVEVFPASTTGWVRVLGHENFTKAWERINSESLNGRVLIATHNEREPIRIRDLKMTRDSHHGDSSALLPPPAATGLTAPYAGSLPSHHATPLSSLVLTSPSSYYNHMAPSGGYPAGGSYQAYPTSVAQPSGFYGNYYNGLYGNNTCYNPAYYENARIESGVSSISSSLESFSIAAQEAAYPPQGTFHGPSPPVPYTGGPSSIITEQRKVIITHLPLKLDEDGLRSHIHKYSGSISELIERIDIPKESANKFKGSATIILDSHEAAIKLVDRLGKSKFQGKLLSVKLCKEGIPIASASSGGGSKGKNRREHKDYAAPDSSQAGPSNSSDSYRQSSGPAIANGSYKRRDSHKRT